MRPQLLTWDVKGTLLCVRRSVGELYSSEAKLHGLQLEARALDRSFQAALQMQDKQFPNYGRGRGLTSQQWWVDVVKKTFCFCGVSDEQVLSPLAEKLYHQFCSAANWEVYGDVQNTLDHCRKIGVSMAVISNFDRRLEQILANCNLRQYFQFVMTSEDAGIAKPDQRIFRAALNLAQVEPRQVMHIGDDIRMDYLAARAVGMESYLICRGQEEEPCGAKQLVPRAHILSSLHQLCDLIK